MPQFIEEPTTSVDPLDPPWLQSHLSDNDPNSCDPTTSDHYCDECSFVMDGWHNSQLYTARTRPKSGRAEQLGVYPHNSFTKMSGLWCTPGYLRNVGYFDKGGDGIPQSVVEYSIVVASELLYRWSGRQYSGLTERVVYPGTSRPAAILGHAYLDNEYQRDTNKRHLYASVHPCDDVCGLADPYVVRLPGPINNVIEIVIDGEVLPASAYRIRSNKELIRVDGKAWPQFNDLTRSPYSLPLGKNVVVNTGTPHQCAPKEHWSKAWAADAGAELFPGVNCTTCGEIIEEIDPNAAHVYKWQNDAVYKQVLDGLEASGKSCSSWVIRYYQGKCPPAAGEAAAAELAASIAKSLANESCFPETTRRIVADGIDVRLSERGARIFQHFPTSLKMVDFFLGATNPNGLARRGYVRRGDKRKQKVVSLRSQIPDHGLYEPTPDQTPTTISKPVNLNVYRGDSYTFGITYKTGETGSVAPYNLTGATVTGQIKVATTDTTPVAVFACSLDNQTTYPGRILIELTSTESAKLSGSLYVYDIQVTFPDTTVKTLLRGKIYVIDDVTEV